MNNEFVCFSILSEKMSRIVYLFHSIHPTTKQAALFIYFLNCNYYWNPNYTWFVVKTLAIIVVVVMQYIWNILSVEMSKIWKDAVQLKGRDLQWCLRFKRYLPHSRPSIKTRNAAEREQQHGIKLGKPAQSWCVVSSSQHQVSWSLVPPPYRCSKTSNNKFTS